MILASVIAFLITIKGPEEVLVPDVVGSEVRRYDVTDAIVRLQEKGLYAKVQLKHSSAIGKGTVIDQRPRPGAVVRAGRRVVLTIIEGPVIDSLGDYVGGDLASLRIELQELFPAGEEALMAIQEPVMYVHDEAETGTILQQSPAEGAAVREGNIIFLDLVVSKGPQDEMAVVPAFLARSYQDAIDELTALGMPFTFAVREAEPGEVRGTVVAQEPLPGIETPEGTVITLTIPEPEPEEGKQFGVLEAELAVYPIRVQMDLVERSAAGDRIIISARHPGGPISWPYEIDEASGRSTRS